MFCGDDHCGDTPPVERLNNTRFCDPLYSNCTAGQTTRNLIENYMDLSPDACMNVFTQDQKNRVRAVLAASPRRQRLVSAANTLPETPTLTVSVGPNPVQYRTIAVAVTFQGQQGFRADVSTLGGQRVYTESFAPGGSRQVFISVPHLSPGVYVLSCLLYTSPSPRD